uniref:Uncharacterized protein n=1 Tax=Siphoviridae sp. ct2vX3 TaxID=2825318 RepID=A0A8S5PXA6_9CAUD|nr:MAG TPA: hypothetical protein [Siphoviridae sp. ct2vX3]
MASLDSQKLSGRSSETFNIFCTEDFISEKILYELESSLSKATPFSPSMLVQPSKEAFNSLKPSVNFVFTKASSAA